MNAPSTKPDAGELGGAGPARFPCAECGARLEFAPGTEELTCPYCGAQNTIPKTGAAVEEADYASALARLEREARKQDRPEVRCGACAAMIQMPEDVAALTCPFCGSSIVATAQTANSIVPGSILPFEVTRERAIDLFRAWLRGRWFAPGALRREGRLDASVSGTYLPAWTYDAETDTAYRGERGDAYWVAETVVINGRLRTRQVRKVRWSPASGDVYNSFDDVLVMASRSLPEPRLEALRPWDLDRLVPYSDAFLAGFRAECYQVGLRDGFEEAQGMMRPVIESSIRADIGGDEQRIDAMRTRYSGVKFKHLLLPVWISAYRYQNRVYQFLVNARTGEVSGSRPYSAAKIALFVLMCLIVAAVVVLVLRAAG